MEQLDTRPMALANGSVVDSDPEIHSGAPVFVGTRVPIQIFVDYLQGGYNLEEFLDHFPSVRREQAVAFIEQATEALLKNSTGKQLPQFRAADRDSDHVLPALSLRTRTR